MIVLIIIAVLTLLLGIVFLSGQGALQKLSDTLNKVIITEKPIADKYRKPLGILLIIFACVLFFIASKVRH